MNASHAIWWQNLQLMQVLPCNMAWHIVAKFNPSDGVNFWVRCASGNVFLTCIKCLGRKSIILMCYKKSLLRKTKVANLMILVSLVILQGRIM